MTDAKNPGAVEDIEPCPFCGAEMAHVIDKEGEFWMHPGVVTDDDCFMSGQGVFPRQLAVWNHRIAAQPAATSQEVGRELHAAATDVLGRWEALTPADRSAKMRLRVALAALAEPAAKAGDAEPKPRTFTYTGHPELGTPPVPVEVELPSPQPDMVNGEGLSAADAWRDLADKDDRTSPEEYPDMALITREELADYMQAAALSPASQSVEKIKEALESALIANIEAITGWLDDEVTTESLADSILSTLPHKEEATPANTTERGRG